MISNFNSSGKLIHFLDLKDWKKEHYHSLFTRAQNFKQNPINKYYPQAKIANLFYEHSTRTSTSFEIAALNLQLFVVNFSVLSSAQNKGESLRDTIDNLNAMGVSLFIIRHPASGAPHFLASHAKSNFSIINAGDGEHAHPSQALIDCFTIQEQKGDISNLRVTICGDILHSRVARSLIDAFRCLDVSSLTLCAPPSLMPIHISSKYSYASSISEAIEGADVIINLRVQKERILSGCIPSTPEYHNRYGITREILRKISPHAILLHPGPVNRGIELDDYAIRDPRSSILNQVSNATAIRMAIIESLLDHG